jgi:glycosyltransferase involved in cell wall biosynthesis
MISVVVPCYNESSVLPLLYDRLTAAAVDRGEDFEVVVVDDGSDERTWSLVRELCEYDPRWKAVRFSRNFGHQTAVTAGLAHACGDAVIVIDADLQDPPEELGRFLSLWREGFEVVYAIRRNRKENLAKRACYRLFYRVLGRLATIPIPADSGDFCLMDRRVVQVLVAMPERNRFVRGLRAWAGFRQIGLEYERPERAAGRPQYSLGKLVRLGLDGVFSSSVAPLRLATGLGILTTALAVVGGLFALLRGGLAGPGPGPGVAALVDAIFFLGGVQLVCLGILGEYIGRIYEDVKARPMWVVRETLGVPEPVEPSGVRSDRAFERTCL